MLLPCAGAGGHDPLSNGSHKKARCPGIAKFKQALRSRGSSIKQKAEFALLDSIRYPQCRVGQ